MGVDCVIPLAKQESVLRQNVWAVEHFMLARLIVCSQL
jgi:hypothetical protein